MIHKLKVVLNEVSHNYKTGSHIYVGPKTYGSLKHGKNGLNLYSDAEYTHTGHGLVPGMMGRPSGNFIMLSQLKHVGFVNFCPSLFEELVPLAQHFFSGTPGRFDRLRDFMDFRKAVACRFPFINPMDYDLRWFI